MAGIKINDLPALGRDLASTDLFEMSLAGGTGSRKITGQEIINGIPLPPSGITIGTTAITSGTVGRVLFEGTGNVVQESANLFWDNTNGRLGIGTSSPASLLEVLKNQNGATEVNISNTTGGASASTLLRLTSSSGSALLGRYSSSTTAYKMLLANDSFFYSAGVSDISFLNDYASGRIKFGAGGTSTPQMTIASTGNVLINTTTDAGYKLDVNGTARTSQLHTFLQGTYLDASTANNYHRVYTGASTYGGLQLQNEIVNYTGYITTGRSGNQLGINFFHTTYAGGISASAHQKFTQNGVQFGSGSLANTLTVFNVGGGNGTVNYPIIANNQLNTTNTGVGYLFQTGDITGAGPINHAAISAWKNNGVAPSITSSLRFYTISDAANTLSEKMRIADSGNVLIGTTTDAGYKLDVNGTQRILGNLTITTGGIGTNTFNANINFLSANQNNVSGRLELQNAANQDSFLKVTGAPTAGAGFDYFLIQGTTTSSTINTVRNVFNVSPAYNLTGAFTGIMRGFYYNPTLTSMTGVTAHWAIHTTSGRVRFEGLPTSPTGLNAGDLYNNLGVLMIV